MVYHHRKVKCPNCNKAIERTVTVDSQVLTGSPFRKCPFCGMDYFDPEYKEPAILAFNEKGGRLSLSGVVWAIVSNGAFLYLLYLAITENAFDSLVIPLCIGAGLALLFDIGIIRMIKNRVHEKEFHQKQIDYLEGRAGNRTIGIAESMDRLSSKEYLDALRSRGVDLPDYFYDRLKTSAWSSKSQLENQSSYYTQNSTGNLTRTEKFFNGKADEEQKEEYLIGNEPENLRIFLISFLNELIDSFPNKQIIWKEWKHESWDTTANYLCKSLGYTNGSSFLEAYGFKIITNESDSFHFCRKCGKRIPSDSAYCPFCGEKNII